MGSVASEREFKIAKRVTTNRGTLKPGNVEKLLFMKYNLRLMNYNYPVDFDPIRSGPVLPLNFTGSPDQENENFQFQTLKFSILKS